MEAGRYVSLYRSPRMRKQLLEYYDRVLATWPIPCQERWLETESGRTHILLCGNESGRPVLLFHGTGNNSLMWRYNAAALGAHFRLHLIDTINDPGKSEASVTFKPATGYAAWTTEVLDALGIEKALLVGHSKGGWIALNAAICKPARVEKLVLLAPAVGINARLQPGFMRRSIRLGLLPSPRAAESFLRYVSAPGAGINQQYAHYMCEVIRGTRHPVTTHRQFSDDELKAVEARVLLLFGDHEVAVDYRSVIARAQRCFGRLDVRIIPEAGHALQGEKPELVDSLIVEHLRK